MAIHITLEKGRVPVKIWTRDIEHDATQQLVNVSLLPSMHGHIAAMPDVHAGIGAKVGTAEVEHGASVLQTKKSTGTIAKERPQPIDFM